MNRFAYCIVAAKRERYVRYTAAYHGVRQCLCDLLCRFNERYSIVIVLFNTSSDGKDIRIKDDVLRQEANFVNQYVVSAGTYSDLTLCAICLAVLVKRHNDYCGTVFLTQACVADKLLFAFFHAY